MNNILVELLQSQLSGNNLSTIGQLLNLGNQNQASSVTNNAVSLLLSALTRNSSNQNGLGALMGALDRDHDGSIMDDIGGFLNGTNNFNNPRMVNGSGILSHLLGNNMGQVVEAFSSQNNLNSNQSTQLLTSLAPIILGALTKSKQKAQTDSNGVFDLLKGASQGYGQQQEQKQSQNILSNLLDQDGDGSIVDDVASLGKNILGNLLKK